LPYPHPRLFKSSSHFVGFSFFSGEVRACRVVFPPFPSISELLAIGRGWRLPWFVAFLPVRPVLFLPLFPLFWLAPPPPPSGEFGAAFFFFSYQHPSRHRLFVKILSLFLWVFSPPVFTLEEQNGHPFAPLTNNPCLQMFLGSYNLFPSPFSFRGSVLVSESAVPPFIRALPQVFIFRPMPFCSSLSFPLSSFFFVFSPTFPPSLLTKISDFAPWLRLGLIRGPLQNLPPPPPPL